MKEEFLADKFEQNRAHLGAVAYRMLGSATEADDAVQEAWLRLSRSDANNIDNLSAWLTTVVGRVCLDMLRSRKSRREDSLDQETYEPIADHQEGTNPEQEALLAESVGLALMVVLDTLAPPERLAFVLHDMFGVSFDEIALIVGRSSEAARQLASRARRRVHGAPKNTTTEISSQREVVDAFITALRAGDFEGLISILDPEVVVRAELPDGQIREIRGAHNWAKGAIAFSRAVRPAQVLMVNGNVGLVLAPHGKLMRALQFKFSEGKIVEVDVIMSRARLDQLELSVLESE